MASLLETAVLSSLFGFRCLWGCVECFMSVYDTSYVGQWGYGLGKAYGLMFLGEQVL